MGDVDDAFEALIDAQDRHESETAIWVKSDDVGPTGSYVLSVEVGPDRSFTLTPDAAAAYARTVLTAVARATHDAAVLDQLGTMASFDSGAQAVADLRRDRPPLDDAATTPLRFVPIILSRTKDPAVNVYWGAGEVTQWSPDDATEHAMFVMLASATVDLDDAYARYLHGIVGVDRPRAMAAVNDLVHWRRDG